MSSNASAAGAAYAQANGGRSQANGTHNSSAVHYPAGHADLLESKVTAEALRRGPSPMRKLAPLLKVDGIVWLAGGLPNKEAFPMTSINVKLYDGSEVVIDCGDEDEEKMLIPAQQYMTENLGLPGLSQWVDKHMKELHGDLPNHKTILTAGSTCSADMMTRVLFEPNNTILICEEYSYPNFLAAADPIGVEMVGIKMDDDGMCPVAMEEGILAKLSEFESDPKIVLYIGTCGQNPTGHTYRRRRLEEIYAVARKFNVIIIEDDPYLYLSFPQSETSAAPGLHGLSCVGSGLDDRCSLLSIDTDARVLRMDTFSKFIAPGLRVSWITMPEELLKPSIFVSQYSTQTGSSLSQILLYKVNDLSPNARTS